MIVSEAADRRLPTICAIQAMNAVLAEYGIERKPADHSDEPGYRQSQAADTFAQGIHS